MPARASISPVRRPSRAGVSIESRRTSEGGQSFYARCTDPRGKRHAVKPPGGGNSWSDWGEAFTAAWTAGTEAARLSYRSRDGERLLFGDLVRDHYLPSLRDASPNTRKSTASHLGDGSGAATRNSRYAQRAARGRLLYAFGYLPIGSIGPSEIQQWITQMAVDGYDVSTIRAKRSLLRSILRVAVDQGWLVQNVVEATRLPKAAERPDRDRVVTPEEWAQIRLQLAGEGTLLLCDLALDCGLRYEEVTVLRPMDVVDGDSRNADHVWVRQASTWPGRAYSGNDEPWLVGPTKGKRFRKVAVSPLVCQRLRLYVQAHGRHPRALIFDYPVLRAEHSQARQARSVLERFSAGCFISPSTGRSGEHGKAHTYTLGYRCPYCRNANTEARFWARLAKGAQSAAPWLDPEYLAARGAAVDPVRYDWFSRQVFGAAVRRAEVGWTPTFHDLRHGMVSWSYDAGASPAVVQRDAGHASVTTTQGYMHVVDKVVGTGRLAAMQVMYDRVQAVSQPEAAVPASASGATLEQLWAIVLSSSSLTAAQQAALLLELARQSAQP